MNVYCVKLLRLVEGEYRYIGVWYIHQISIHEALRFVDSVVKNHESWSKWRQVSDMWYSRERVQDKLWVYQIIIGDVTTMSHTINSDGGFEW